MNNTLSLMEGNNSEPMFTNIVLNEDEIDKIAKMTDRNDHDGALIAGAVYLKHKKLEKIFRAIASIHDVEGSMPRSLDTYRYEKSKELWNYASQELDPVTLDRFQGAY